MKSKKLTKEDLSELSEHSLYLLGIINLENFMAKINKTPTPMPNHCCTKMKIEEWEKTLKGQNHV